jgi:hypothetical protein
VGYEVLMLPWEMALTRASMDRLRDAFTAWTRDGYWRARVNLVVPTAETK